MRLFLVLTIICFSLSAQLQTRDFKVIAYYAGSAGDVENFQYNQITHVIHCFSHLKGNQLDLGGEAGVAALKKLVSLKKKHPHLKVLLSLGGWGGCKTCSEVFSQADDRQAFAESVKEALVKYDADGIDLDWEYPAVEGPPGHPLKPADRENFTALVLQLRQTLGNDYVISFAAGGFEDYMEHAIEWKKVSDIVDFINLMSYDLVNGYATVTGHHTPLYSTPEQLLSVDYGVRTMIEKGVPAHKIIIGLAFYGRIWEGVPNENNGLYQSGRFKESKSIQQVDQLKNKDGYAFFWDDGAQAPYMYNKEKGLFYTYDDKQSVKLKTQYALEKGLGGVMFWQLRLDYPRNGLLQVIDETIDARLGGE